MQLFFTNRKAFSKNNSRLLIENIKIGEIFTNFYAITIDNFFNKGHEPIYTSDDEAVMVYKIYWCIIIQFL